MSLKNKNTENNMFELPFIFCDEKNELEVYEDCESKLMELAIKIAKELDCGIKIIKREPRCPVCHEILHHNGTKPINLNKDLKVKYQKYIHKKCEKSSCMSSLEKIKDKGCNYLRKIRENGLIKSFIGHMSYQSKKELIFEDYNIHIPRSTILYHEQTLSNDYLDSIEHAQYQRIKQMNIKPSGVYCYDEQYVFVNKTLYMRMTLIDHITKLVLYEQIVSNEEFDNNTIENFLKTAINTQPLKTIITDGRKSYNTIIEATGAIHQRCYFHAIHNLMTPLLKHKNKRNRRIKKLNNEINKKEEQIQAIQKNKKHYIGRIPLKDKKTHRQNQKIKKYTKIIKKDKKEIRNIEKRIKKNRQRHRTNQKNIHIRNRKTSNKTIQYII